MVSLKRSHFSTYHCVFFPTVVQILVGRLDLCFLTHTKKFMTPIHALIFQKHVKCVFILDVLKSRCNFTTLLGKYMQQKKVGWEAIFSELRFAGSGALKPRREFEGTQHPRAIFSCCFEAYSGFNCVVKLPHKSQCKTYDIC